MIDKELLTISSSTLEPCHKKTVIGDTNRYVICLFNMEISKLSKDSSWNVIMYLSFSVLSRFDYLTKLVLRVILVFGSMKSARTSSVTLKIVNSS